MSFPLFDILEKRAELGPERLAMRELVSGQSVDYATLNRRAAHCAGLLASLAVEPGDRIALLCRNRIEFFEILFACGKLGAVLVPLNWRMPATELEPLIADCTPKVLIHGQEDRETAAALSAPCSLDLDDPSDYPSRRDTARPHSTPRIWPDDETWYLLYTSGTTGQPKAVIQTYGMALANHVNITQGMGLRGEDVTLNFLPLFHTGGINLVTLPALIDGASVLILPGFDVDKVVELIDAGQLDNFFGVPAIYQAISLHPRFDEIDFGKVRSWACGGAPMPENLLKQFEERGACVLNGMGMTETGPTLFLMDKDHAAEKIGSVGKPQLLSSVRLVDPDGNDVPDGESGELWFAGPNITPGYWNRPEETKKAKPDGTWLRSGDLGQRDEDGYYFIVGRLKDMYISGGENVFPAEVEAHLAEHPDILEAAIIGISDERWGEVGQAYLLPRPGHQLPGADELKEYCRARMAPYKVPQSFVPVDDFPRTAAGKVQKHLLAERG
jgi:fatty-acyl-CoA synthase